MPAAGRSDERGGDRVARLLAAQLGGRWSARPLGASGFCSTWRAEGASGALFVKTLDARNADVLAAEADGLQALRATASIRVPAAAGVWTDAAGDLTLLAMEWLDLAPAARDFGERFGAALAALHAAAPAEGGGCFGWRRDNRLGATPQRNRWSDRGGADGWIAFFATERLGTMRARLVRAHAPAALAVAIDRVVAALPALFADGHAPRPSLIHGDLWSGNWGSLADGTPVVFDPAVSVSDAEAELAMTELFGAPPPAFWRAYSATAPVADGYPRRRLAYQLYHLLNHELLFGGYAGRAIAVADAIAKST